METHSLAAAFAYYVQTFSDHIYYNANNIL